MGMAFVTVDIVAITGNRNSVMIGARCTVATSAFPRKGTGEGIFEGHQISAALEAFSRSEVAGFSSAGIAVHRVGLLHFIVIVVIITSTLAVIIVGIVLSMGS